LDEGPWKLLYETYLYEEFLMNVLAGRALNCNRIDDSSIYHVKGRELIESRLSFSLPKEAADRTAQRSRLAYKIPDVVPFLPQVKRYYPGTKIIAMTRKAPEVFNSMLEKGWFNSRTLRERNLTWPNRFIDGLRIPFWVDPRDDEKWCEMDELHRIAYYYLRVNQSIYDIPGCVTVKYDDLVEDPGQTISVLANQLGLTRGDKTNELLGTVHRTIKDRNDDILTELKPDVRAEVEYYSTRS
jgi:hypothetical protein